MSGVQQRFLVIYKPILFQILSPYRLFSSVQFSSVAQSCLTLCNPMNRSTPGLHVHHQLQEFTQTHVHWVSDAIQSCHPLSSPSPPAPNPLPASESFPVSQLFARGGQSTGISALASFLPKNIQDWSPLELTSLDLLAVQGTQESSPTPQFSPLPDMYFEIFFASSVGYLFTYSLCFFNLFTFGCSGSLLLCMDFL